MNDESSSSENLSNKKEKKNSNLSSALNKDIIINNNNNSNYEEEDEDLKNYFEYIDKCLSDNEENRQNYYNKIEDLKQKITEIKTNKLESIDYILIILDDFIKISDEFYTTFEKTKEIITKFNDLNDQAQNFFFIYQKMIYSTSYFKEINQKLTKEIERKEKENQKLKNTIKEMNDLDIKKENLIYSINVMKKENENKDNGKKEMKNKIDNLIEENKELKRRYSQVITQSQMFKDIVDEKYILKQESTRRMECLMDKITTYENKIDNLQNKIFEIEKEKKEKKEKEKEEDEDEKNNEKYKETEIMITPENLKTYLNDVENDNNSININQVGFNLEELLYNDEIDNEDKSEGGAQEKNKNISEGNVEENKSGIGKFPKHNEYDIDAEAEIEDIVKKPNLLTLCPINQIEYNKNNVNIKNHFSILSSPKSSFLYQHKKIISSNSVDKMKNNRNRNAFKIFFFLLLRSIIINYDILKYFQKDDYEALYKECQKENIPFNEFQEWILKKIKINEFSENITNNIYVDSTFIDCFISSSMI